MDFSHFIQPYLITVHHVTEDEGRYEGGEWIPGEPTEIPFQAAVVPFNDDALQFGEAGTYTAHDRKIFTYRKLADGEKVKVDGVSYTVTEERYFSFNGQGLKIDVGRRDGVASK